MLKENLAVNIIRIYTGKQNVRHSANYLTCVLRSTENRDYKYQVLYILIHT